MGTYKRRRMVFSYSASAYEHLQSGFFLFSLKLRGAIFKSGASLAVFFLPFFPLVFLQWFFPVQKKKVGIH
jgi:hypothetical protein